MVISLHKDKLERNLEMIRQFLLGVKQVELAGLYGISRERVRQIVGNARNFQSPKPKLTSSELATIRTERYRIRFWNRVDQKDKDKCWFYTGYRYPSGYGHICMNHGNGYAHRYAYEITKGIIPDGLFVLHTCDNPPCCNPKHLYLGDQAQNVRDRESRGRGNRHKRGV